MAHQSHSSRLNQPLQQDGPAPTVSQWMQDVLGQSSGSPSADTAPAVAPAGDDMKTRLAAIAKNIETLESKVAGAPANTTPQTSPLAPNMPADLPSDLPTQPVSGVDPLEALRRRKAQLEAGEALAESALEEPAVADPVTHAPAQPKPAQPKSTQPQPSQLQPSQPQPAQAAMPDSGLDALNARLDAQFARLADAVGEVRHLAQSSASDQAGLKSQVEALQTRMAEPAAYAPADKVAEAHDAPHEGPSLAELSDQVRAVQDAIAQMSKPEAIQSLEDGYHHVLARIDELKDVGTPDTKIDALYNEVTLLRGQIDTLNEGGTAGLVGEMRTMINRLESNPQSDADQITQALESVKEMARTATQPQDSTHMSDAIGAVVERLVALEARIEALAAGRDDSVLSERLDTIQSEMVRLSDFQDQARGLTSAIDTIREELSAGHGLPELPNFDERFAALDRIEEMTGGHAAQVEALSARLSALDSSVSSQGDMAREVAALAHQLDEFTAGMPLREIEQTMLDLTGRVTALQEDTSAERLGVAVRELGERVESCLKTIPKTEAIIEAVEAKLDSRLEGAFDPLVARMDGMDDRLDGIARSISAADGPLIDNMASRLEALITAMPSPRADDALATLEQQLADINSRYEEAGMVSRDEVIRLHNELARARASVELGANQDLQSAIVDQVRHLADRFDAARTTGDADLLPEIEAQIEALAERVQELGLFHAGRQAVAPAMSDALIERIEQRLEAPAYVEGVDTLQSELVSLRETASDQDERMQNTLESVQSALETVIRRINALEGDDEAAKALASSAAETKTDPLADVKDALQAGAAPAQPMPTESFVGPHSQDTSIGDMAGANMAIDAMPAADMPAADTHVDPVAVPAPAPAMVPAAAQTPEPAPAMVPAAAQTPEPAPEPGDAQTLLRQLSGAMDSTAERPSRLARRQEMRAAKAAGSRRAPSPNQDAMNQRASFIAAARRAAQAAALQAADGTTPPPSAFAPPLAPVAPTAAPTPAAMPFAQEPAPEMMPNLQSAAHAAPDSASEPAVNADQSALPGDASNQIDRHADHEPETPIAPSTPVQELGGAAKTAREEQSQKKAREEKRQRMMSRAMLVAIVLFTVALGLFVVSLVMPGDRADGLQIAPLPPTQQPVNPMVDDGQLGTAPVAPPADDRVGDSSASADAVRVVGDVPAAVPVETPGASDDVALSDGFERDGSPVMGQTPGAEETASMADAMAQDGLAQEGTLEEGAAALENAANTASEATSDIVSAAQGALPPPANDLGPLLNLPIPALPAATADALPEAIGSPRLRVAAAGGDASAAFEVATRFMEGRFVPQDLPAAAHWYGRAADQGVIPAAYRLGSFYEQGRGVDRNRDAAIAWYERAALGGSPRAMHNLAVMAAEGTGGSPDFSRAAGWFIPAANRGLADSQFNLAVLFARGMGVERDLMDSYKWFALAANAGDSEAVGRRDEVAGVLGEQALALARARVDNWQPVPVDGSAIAVAGPPEGWDDTIVRAGTDPDATATQRLIAQAQTLLAQRGYEPGPADGLLGPRTNDAVRAFRQSVGLGNSQTIDQALVEALRQQP